MDGFTKVNNEIVFDEGLSLGARVAYPAFLHLAWRAGRRKEGDGVEMPTLLEVAKLVGCSRTALISYKDELRRVGLLVTVRPRNQGMVYFVFDSVAESDSVLAERKARSESGLAQVRNPDSSRARSSSEPKDGPEITPPTPLKGGGEVDVVNLDVVPDVWLEPREGQRPQNLPLNALCEVCHIDVGIGSPQVRAAVAALNGRGAARPGIRELYWRECRRYAAAHPEAEAELLALQQDPERFARMLEERVRRKAAMILERQPWRTQLAPADMLKLWVDIELAPSRPRGGLSPEQIERIR